MQSSLSINRFCKNSAVYQYSAQRKWTVYYHTVHFLDQTATYYGTKKFNAIMVAVF